MDKGDYLDHIILETLNHLSKSEDGLRYSDLKTKLNVSDTSLANRLNKLKASEYVSLEAKINDVGRNYIAYILTAVGIQLVKELDVPTLLQKVENQLID